MERKLVQIGKSLAVTLPAEVVKAFKLKKGQGVDVSVHPTTGAVTIRPGAKYIEDGRVTDRFRTAVDSLLEKRHELYRRLAE
jgi:antitoxin component of MazEF toxin-antitoxin module